MLESRQNFRAPPPESATMRRISRPLIAIAAELGALALLAGPSAAAEDDSSFASQSVPASAIAGSRFSVSLTFTNTGATAWTVPGGYMLGCPNPVTGANWSVDSVALPSLVPAGSKVTFTFSVTAPVTPGTYEFQWQLQKGATFFGAPSANVPIKVRALPATQ
jgi:hypothetical protein